MRKISLEGLIQQVDDVPVLPNVVYQVMALTEDPHSTIQDLEQVILQDQSLTARILRLANSAYYGYPRKISTLSEAVVLLGFSTMRNIVLAATMNKFLLQEVPGYGLQRGELWRHSQSCAVTAWYIAKKAKMKQADKAYTAALLEDIGKVILSIYMEEAYEEILKRMEEEKRSFLHVEKEILGFHHGEIGAKIAEKWNLPPDLVEVIAYHHEPEQAKENPLLTSIVHVANGLVMMMGIGLGVDGTAYPISDFALQQLGMSTLEIQQIMSDVSDLLVDEDAFLTDFLGRV